MTFRLLFFALLSTSVGQSVVLATLPSLGREVGLNEFNVAFLLSSSAVVYAVGNTLWSKVIQKKGYKRVLIIGLTGYTIGTLIFATVWLMGFYGWLVGNILFLVLIIARTAQSAVMSATPPSAIGMAISISSADIRIKSISKVSSAQSLGQILGPTFAGLAVSIHLLAPLYAIALFTLVTTLLIWRYLPPATPAVSEDRVSETHIANQQKPTATLLIGLNVSVFFATAMMQQSLAFMLMDEHLVNSTEAIQGVGLAMIIIAVTALFVQISFVQRTRIGASNLIRTAFSLLVVGYTIISLHKDPTEILVAMVFIGAGMGISVPAITALANATCKPEHRTSITGFITASPAIGYILGPPVAAAVYQLDHRGPFFTAVVLLGFASVFAFTQVRTKPYQ